MGKLVEIILVIKTKRFVKSYTNRTTGLQVALTSRECFLD